MGRHNGDDIVDDDVRIALWNDLIMRPSLLYDASEVEETFNRHFAQAEAMGKVACGVSQEVLTLSLVGGVDITERARRLQAAMGADTRIVMVVRNQLDWIESVFCGLLKEGGMTIGLEEFLFYFYYQQDQSPFSTLFYDRVFELYADLFGTDNVHVVPFELIKRDAGAFARAVCDAIGVPHLGDVPAQSINPRPSSRGLSACLAYNRDRRFYFGAHHFRRPFAFGAAPIFAKRFGIDPPLWMTEERELSMVSFKNIEEVVRQALQRGDMIPPMATTFPPQYTELFVEAYAPHNVRLAELTGLDLASHGYPV